MEVPFPAEVPPQELEYHCHAAPVASEPPFSVSVIGVPEHTVDEGLAVTEVAAADKVLKITVALMHIVVVHVPSALT
jgi:hypothetical protein